MMHKVWCSIEEVSYWFWWSSIKFQGHSRQKIADLGPNWAFPDCNWSFNSTMALKGCTKPNVAKKRCPIVLLWSSIKFQGHKGQTLLIWTRIEHFRTVTPIWIEFTDGFEMMHKAWCSMEEVSYYLSRLSIKFQGHMYWKIDDLNPNWERLLGWSQLSNPSDLPCFYRI